MANNDVFSAVEQMVKQNPNLLDTPFKKALYKAVQERDSEKGEELARNFCTSMGVDPQTAYNAAGNFMQNLIQNGPPQMQKH